MLELRNSKAAVGVVSGFVGLGLFVLVLALTGESTVEARAEHTEDAHVEHSHDAQVGHTHNESGETASHGLTGVDLVRIETPYGDILEVLVDGFGNAPGFRWERPHDGAPKIGSGYAVLRIDDSDVGILTSSSFSLGDLPSRDVIVSVELFQTDGTPYVLASGDAAHAETVVGRDTPLGLVGD